MDPLTTKLWRQSPLTVWLARKFVCTYTRPPGFPPVACQFPLADPPFSQPAYVHEDADVLKAGFSVVPFRAGSVFRASWTCSHWSSLAIVLRKSGWVTVPVTVTSASANHRSVIAPVRKEPWPFRFR